MARNHDGLSNRPERVVILDADDPMTEIHGRFVWQEEHNRAVEEARQLAFGEGYEAGLMDATASVPAQVTIRHRRTIAHRIQFIVVILVLLLAVLMLPVILL